MWFIPPLYAEPLSSGPPGARDSPPPRHAVRPAPHPAAGVSTPTLLPLVSPLLSSQGPPDCPCFFPWASVSVLVPLSVTPSPALSPCLSPSLPGRCLRAPFPGSPVPLRGPRALSAAAGTGPSAAPDAREPGASGSARLGREPGEAAPRLQRGPLGAGDTAAGSPTRARAPDSPRHRPPVAPSLCAASNGRSSARLARKLFSRTSVIGGVPIVQGD